METSNFNNLRIEVHGHKGYDVNGPMDITAFVSAVEWSDSVRPPWNTCLVTMQCGIEELQWLLPGTNEGTDEEAKQESEWFKQGKMDARDGGPTGPSRTKVADLPHGRRFRPGAWIIIRLHDVNATLDAPAVAFCYISEVTLGFGMLQGINANPTGTVPVTIKGISWFQAAGQSNIRVAATGETETNGSIFTMTSWSDEMLTILQNSTNNSLGQALQQIWQKVISLLPPDTLVPKSVGEPGFWQQIPVVYDDATAVRFARDRAGAMHPVFGLYLLNAPAFTPQAPVWGWLHNTFVPDDSIVEAFPTLEWPHVFGYRGEAGDYVPPWAESKDVPGGPAGSSRTHGADVRGDASRYSTAGTEHTTHLGQLLGGAQPVLVYRFKPFQMRPINTANSQPLRGEQAKDDSGTGFTVPMPVSEKLKLFQAPITPKPTNAWSNRRYEFGPSDIVAMSSIKVSDDDRVNLVYARNFLTGDAGIRMYNQGGNAVLGDKGDFQRYGLHAAEPVWPYVLVPGLTGEATDKATPVPATPETKAAAAAVAAATAVHAAAQKSYDTLASVFDTQKVLYDAAKAAVDKAQAVLNAAPSGGGAGIAANAALTVATKTLSTAKVTYDSAVGSLKAADTYLAETKAKLDDAKKAEASAKATPSSAQQQTINDHLSALNEKLWTILGEGERFVSLSMEVKCRPRVKAGMWARIALEGRQFGTRRDAGVYRYLTAYIEGVTHQMSRGAKGAWKTSTRLQLTRGLFSDQPDYFYSPVRACSVTRNNLNYGTTGGSSVPVKLSTNFHSGTLNVSQAVGGATIGIGSPDGAAIPGAVLTSLGALAQAAEVIYAAHKFSVVSGYRSPAANVAANGATNSYHMQGKALDMRGTSTSALSAVIEKLITDKKIPQGGVILYPTFVHYDQRGSKYRKDNRTPAAADE